MKRNSFWLLFISAVFLFQSSFAQALTKNGYQELLLGSVNYIHRDMVSRILLEFRNLQHNEEQFYRVLKERLSPKEYFLIHKQLARTPGIGKDFELRRDNMKVFLVMKNGKHAQISLDTLLTNQIEINGKHFELEAIKTPEDLQKVLTKDPFIGIDRTLFALFHVVAFLVGFLSSDNKRETEDIRKKLNAYKYHFENSIGTCRSDLEVIKDSKVVSLTTETLKFIEELAPDKLYFQKLKVKPPLACEAVKTAVTGIRGFFREIEELCKLGESLGKCLQETEETAKNRDLQIKSRTLGRETSVAAYRVILGITHQRSGQ